jgi:uncharacterized protein (UPF0333 family)
MSKRVLVLALLLIAVAGAAFASSTFQGSCSNITFAYANNQAALQAVCLRANGTANPSTLLLQGIGNNNGTLVQGSGASTFQQSCGNIQIQVQGSQVVLSGLCRTGGGASNPTSLPLNGIGNNNGNLTY